MPVLFQWLTLLNPLRHYLEIVRAIFLKGAGLDALWPQFLALLVMGAGAAVASPRRGSTRRCAEAVRAGGRVAARPRAGGRSVPPPGAKRNRPTDPSPGGAWLSREVIAVRAG